MRQDTVGSEAGNRSRSRREQETVGRQRLQPPPTSGTNELPMRLVGAQWVAFDSGLGV